MCLALIALEAHPRFALVIAANRDEYHARPAAPAAWWDEGWLGGRDLAAGGAWLGVARSGRWALVTNVRDPSRHDPSAPSRGALVAAALADPAPRAAMLTRLAGAGAACNGFNLVVGRGAAAHWISNRAQEARALDTGIHGLSNAALDTPWPKVVRTKAALAAWCARGDDDLAALFAVLGDRARAPDDLLPETGVPRERERLLSSPFIVDEYYGTRCSTVVTIARDGGARFVERSFDPRGAQIGEVVQSFAVDRDEAQSTAIGRSR